MIQNDKINFIRKKCIVPNPEILEPKFGYVMKPKNPQMFPTDTSWRFCREFNHGQLALYSDDYGAAGMHKSQFGILGRPIRRRCVVGDEGDFTKYGGSRFWSINAFQRVDEDTESFDRHEVMVDGKRRHWNLRADDLERPRTAVGRDDRISLPTASMIQETYLKAYFDIQRTLSLRQKQVFVACLA